MKAAISRWIQSVQSRNVLTHTSSNQSFFVTFSLKSKVYTFVNNCSPNQWIPFLLTTCRNSFSSVRRRRWYVCRYNHVKFFHHVKVINVKSNIDSYFFSCHVKMAKTLTTHTLLHSGWWEVHIPALFSQPDIRLFFIYIYICHKGISTVVCKLHVGDFFFRSFALSFFRLL